MQKNQFTDEQIVALLQQAEKGEQTIAHEAACLREMEKENARLKRLLAERDLELDIIKELLQTPIKP